MDPQLPPGPWPGTILANRYRVEASLGKGGMGVVYRAQTKRFDAK